MRSLILVPVVLAVGLSGCMSLSRSSAVSPLSADWSKGGRITEITVQAGPTVTLPPQFDDLFKRRVQAKADACARGSRPLRLEARIDRLDKANPVLVMAVAGANVLRGEGRIVDVATGQTVGDYKVGKTIVGGKFSIVSMSQAQKQLSDAFGDELCKQAFRTKATVN